MHQVGYRGLWGDLEIGAGYHLDVHNRVRLSNEQSDITPLDPLPPLADSTVSSGVSVNLVYDSRDNPLNAASGYYSRASYTYYREALGSDEDWEDLQLEARGFRRLPASRRQVVAAWALSRLTRAGEPPYLDLPSTGWDTYGRTARGYRIGRFRGKDWIYGELEYRVDVTRNGLVGAVGFVNTSTLRDFESSQFQRWVVGGGESVPPAVESQRQR